MLLKYAEQLLGERYPKYSSTILRASTMLVTNEDATAFAKMMVELYELGYLKAVNDYKGQMEAHGLKVSIRSERKNENG